MNAKTLLAFLGGLAAGAGIALLLAPTSGGELRHRIGRILEEKGVSREKFDAIIAQAKANLKANDSVAIGLLRNSGRTVVQPDNTVDAGFYARYAEYVEYGRPPGKMPPVDVLEQYIRRKGRKRNSALKAAAVFSGKSEEELARSAAWGMAKSIAEKGTRPHPFLKPAYDQYRIRIAQFMQGKINMTCDKYKTK